MWKARHCEFLGGLTWAESIRAKQLSVAERTLSPHLSNYSNRPGSALSHSLWGHEINTCSATINKCLFKWQRLLAPPPSLPSSSLGFRNVHPAWPELWCGVQVRYPTLSLSYWLQCASKLASGLDPWKGLKWELHTCCLITSIDVPPAVMLQFDSPTAGSRVRVRVDSVCAYNNSAQTKW